MGGVDEAVAVGIVAVDDPTEGEEAARQAARQQSQAQTQQSASQQSQNQQNNSSNNSGYTKFCSTFDSQGNSTYYAPCD